MLAARHLIGGGMGGFTVPSSATLYALYNGSDDAGATYAIGAATRSGGTWTRYASNPVLTKGAGAAWDAGGVKDPFLVWDGAHYVMYYSGYSTGSPVFKIGRATASSVNGPWTKDAGNPVVGLGAGGAFDSAQVQAPSVAYIAGGVGGHAWWLWYVGSNGSSSAGGLTHSDDGITWTKDGTVAAAGFPIYAGSFSMLYSAGGVNLTTFATPTGTYTPDGGNPLLRERGTVANTSPAPTANLSAGGTAITVASGAASGLNVGEPVILVDSNSGPEVRTVGGLTSTQITLSAGSTYAYQVADGFTVRSLAYTIIDVRSAVPTRGGGWEAYGATFRPLDGLTFSGNSLWEGSLRYTAPALSGPWSYDFTTGLIFPLTQIGTSWDSTSAENLSVIIAP